jgi:hypothetical protein
MASYAEEVIADAPYRYWKMNEPSGTSLAENSGSTAITLAGGPVPGVAGMTTQMGTAVSFDGVDDYGRVATGVDLSTTAIATVEFALLWDTHGTNDDLAAEYGDANATGGWLIDPNDSGAATQFAAMMVNAGAFANKNIPAPTTGVWHHFAFVFDRAAADANQTTFYVDGAAVTESITSSATMPGNFGSLPLNVMCRTTAGVRSLFGAGDMQHLAIYTSALSPTRIAAHYAARANAPAGAATARPPQRRSAQRPMRPRFPARFAR